MAKKWLGLFGGGQEDVSELLEGLARHRLPVQAEIEQSHIRFQTQLSLKEKAVILAKPLTLAASELHTGGYVRIRWAGGGQQAVRLEIMAPHFNLPNGGAGFVCKRPTGSVAAKRKRERYDTSRFTNLKLEVGGGAHRVLDLCASGCRVAMTADSSLARTALGKDAGGAILLIGDGTRVELELLIPRSRHGGAVGCEFRVKQDGRSAKILTQVLQSVQSRQFDRVHTG